MASHSEICQSPNLTISCQDLLRSGSCFHSGWLRRQSLRNKFKIFAWTQVYVVISSGCVYCFGNEVSKKPASAFSLYGYNKVFRAGEITSKEATWVFKIVHVNGEFRSYMFSASSEKEMKLWMKCLKQEMLRANGKLPRSQGDGASSASESFIYGDSGIYNDAGSALSVSSDYAEMEQNIYEESAQFTMPKGYKNKREDEDSDEEMDKVVTKTLRDPRDRPPLPPPIPHRTKKGEEEVKVTRPAVPPKRVENAIIGGLQRQIAQQTETKSPSSSKETVDQWLSQQVLRGSPEGQSIKKKHVEEKQNEKQVQRNESEDFWSTIYYYGDSPSASQIIREIADEGVYLVRVNDDKSMVLHCYADSQSRKYRIIEENKKYTLSKTSGNFFRSVPELVYFYYTNKLPNVDVYLADCYAECERKPSL